MFFFIPFVTMPFLYLVMIYIAAAILPAILLMRYVYQQDSIEKEPPQLLISLAWHGVLAALVSIVLEMIAQSILNVTLDQNDPRYQYVLAFLCVAYGLFCLHGCLLRKSKAEI